jgi:RNA polymerase sigma-70 factor, ECF subfamily
MSDKFSRLYNEHVADVYGYFAYRVGSRTEAEQLTQATFERAFRERATFGSERKETSVHLLKIARETRRNGEREGTVIGGDLGIEADLARALERLEQLDRAVLSLRYGARLAAPEIARVLGVSEHRVRRAHSRGLRRVRTELERSQRPDPAEPRSGPAGDQQGGDEQQGEAEREAYRGPESPA